MKYLKNIRTLEELKKEYHKWASRLHPDAGGDGEEMKLLNTEYEELFKKVKGLHLNKEGKIYRKETNETSADFQIIIEKLLHFNGIFIEIIGCFVWVSGNTKPYKEELKAMGMRWHSKKQCWYLSPEGYKRHGREEYSLDDIRGMYGVDYSEEVKLNELQAAEA